MSRKPSILDRAASRPVLAGAGGLCLALCLLASAAPLRAEGEAETIVIPAEKFRPPASREGGDADSGIGGNRRFNFDGFRARVDTLWFQRKAFLKKNLPEPAAEQMTEIADLCQEVGVSRLDGVAAALVREGRGYLDEGNFEKAVHSFQDALRFSPDLPEAHFDLARAHWRGASGLGSALTETLAGVRALIQNSTLSSAVLGNFLIIAILAFAGTAVLFSIAMVIRYQTLIRHDLTEALAMRSPDRYPREALALLGWGVVLLPLLTWILALWTPAYWLALTYRYQKLTEKLISTALLVMLILSAPAARAAGILFGLAADPSARMMLASASASYDPEQIVSLEEKADENPGDPAYPFLLGGLYARGRYFQDALAQYGKVLDLDPNSYRAYNNIGNIYYRTGRTEEALKHYKSALGIRKDFLPAYYNTYLARQILLQLREAEEALRQGQTIDPAGMAKLVDGARSRGSGEPVEATISRDEVFKRILGDRGARAGIMASLATVPSIVAAIFLLAAILLTVLLGSRHAERCVKCGEPFCHRCKASSQGPEYCPQCEHLFLTRDGLAPAVRREKLAQADHFRIVQARVSRLASIVVPGMGRVLDGRTTTGAVLSLAWFAALFALALRPRLLHLPGAGSVRPFVIVTVLLGALAAAVWIMGNLRPVREAGGPPGSWRWR